jgi:hypothetical protein
VAGAFYFPHNGAISGGWFPYYREVTQPFAFSR